MIANTSFLKFVPQSKSSAEEAFLIELPSNLWNKKGISMRRTTARGMDVPGSDGLAPIYNVITTLLISCSEDHFETNNYHTPIYLGSCLYLDCYSQNISTVVAPGLIQVFV